MQLDFDWQMYLAAARGLSDPQLKDCMYRQALRKAEELYGAQSLQAGLVLLDLSDCLQAQGLKKEADEMVERAYNNLRCYIRRSTAAGAYQWAGSEKLKIWLTNSEIHD